MSKLTDQIHKLISLAGNNPNENEKISAALKACQLIRDNNLSFSGEVRTVQNDKARVAYEQATEAVFSSQQSFYSRIIALNGSPREIICKKLSRCSICSRTLHVGDIVVWIPKTMYVFDPQCWSKLKIKVTPR